MAMRRQFAAALVWCTVCCVAPAGAQPHDICRFLGVNDFNERLEFMATNPESCHEEGPCFTNYPHWDESIEFQIVALPSSEQLRPTVETLVDRTTDELSALTMLDFRPVEENANLFVVVLDDEMLEYLMSGAVPDLDLEQFSKVQKTVYESGNCSGTIFTDAQQEYERIELGVIYVNANHTGERLERCVREELMNVMGLIGDPPGQASLFDEYNFRMIDGRFRYSVETEAMLQVLYSFVSSGAKNLSEFEQLVCVR